MSTAVLQILERPQRFAPDGLGVEEASRRVRVVAWRAMAALHRRSSHRHEVPMELPPEPMHLVTAEGALVGRRAAERVDALLRAAARQYGGRRPERLERALRERLEDDGTDVDVARRHGLPRETLNRARSWLSAQLLREIREAA
ncbi:MAG: hypothetical protein Q8P41_12995 [Pseudomonadota bacterium]|nr:hypothetical protein [Pseudomonadota bacterium]